MVPFNIKIDGFSTKNRGVFIYSIIMPSHCLGQTFIYTQGFLVSIGRPVYLAEGYEKFFHRYLSDPIFQDEVAWSTVSRSAISVHIKNV